MDIHDQENKLNDLYRKFIYLFKKSRVISMVDMKSEGLEDLGRIREKMETILEDHEDL